MTNMQIEHPQTANLSKILITSKLVEGILQKLRDGDEEFIPFTLNKLPGQVNKVFPKTHLQCIHYLCVH